MGVEVRIMVGEDTARGELTFGHVILTPLLSPNQESITGNDRDFMSVLSL